MTFADMRTDWNTDERTDSLTHGLTVGMIDEWMGSFVSALRLMEKFLRGESVDNCNDKLLLSCGQLKGF